MAVDGSGPGVDGAARLVIRLSNQNARPGRYRGRMRLARRTRVLFDGPQARRAVSDAAAILLFAVIGVLSHDHALTFVHVLRDAGPVGGGWFLAALLLGAYRRPGWRTLLPTWVLGVTGGVLVRAGILGRAIDGHQAAFLVTTLVVVLVLVLGLRLFGRLAATRLAGA